VVTACTTRFKIKKLYVLADTSVLCLMWISEQTTGQLDQGFPWFSSVPQQMLRRYQNSTSHCTLPTRLSPKKLKIFVETPPSQRKQIFVITLPSKHKTEPKCSSSSLCNILTTTLPSSLSSTQPRFQIIFMIRTSGHSLRIFRAVNFSSVRGLLLHI